ncbi:hypothetical protein G6F31_015542 [Rhizopus arrhizus]|nr:hypothetical protein G6F31_015542 [Rhizopus arrhizus]
MATLGELDRIAQQVEQDLAYAHLVTTDADRTRRIVATLEIQPALLGHRLHQHLYLVEQAGQIERTQVQLQPAGLDAGEVQRIVDQSQQVASGLLDRAGIAALHRVQRRGQQQLAHPQHAGHRCAHLMAQRGQEATLGLRSLLGQLLLVHGQLPLLATAQAPPDRPGQAAGGQPGQRTLTIPALLHPVLVIAAHPEAVAVALWIGIRQQACVDLQVTIIRPKQQGAGIGQWLPAACVIAAHAYLGNHQRRRRQRDVSGIHVEGNQAGLGDGEHAAIGIHCRRPAGEFGIGQAIAFIEQLQ